VLIDKAIKSFGKSSNRADGPSPAAAYVRMSTDHQKYSTENQLDTIRRYAEQRGYTIVRVFEDSGRSGLRMDGREGLQSLMLEVQSGTASFQAILVYDVSRWGRFHDCRKRYHRSKIRTARITSTSLS
jgi:DNA invertase Pin-like site-specific DNA recombinase